VNPVLNSKWSRWPLTDSGIHDSARVLKTNKNTVLSTLKKVERHHSSQSEFSALKNPEGNLAVRLVCDEAEMDEQWSFVGNKANQRWFWYAVGSCREHGIGLDIHAKLQI
jgi:hypothetical protein